MRGDQVPPHTLPTHFGHTQMNQQNSILLLIGHGSPAAAGNDEFMQFAADLAQHVGVATQPCFLELAEPAIGEGVARCVARGATEILALPLFLGAGRHQKRDVPNLLDAAQAEHAGLVVRYGAPLGPQLHLVGVLAERAAAALATSRQPVSDEETAVLLVGRGSKDPQSNAELARLARLLSEIHGYGMVEYAYQTVVSPDVGQALSRCVRLGARRVVVLPYLLFAGFVRDDIVNQARQAQEQHPQVEILVGQHLFPHAGLLAAAAFRYEELRDGMVQMNCASCVYRQHGDDGDGHHHHHH
ncbi:MAG: sirohydrochlorin chelatase [Candidatus Viridilinea halotolerans]|uniref:Sirohydrochlorin chelatase n=1 Tax=Candidatus Viridilinea halotolerans TaxID=2491704 RepID=A0A426U9R8_9CHLR|nr:MAG: sirohydrochlorin chelatase [Candidatus Viridilinea halotolerans]